MRAPRQERALAYAIALLLLPVLVLWRHDDALYSPLWYADTWFYLGYFRDLVSFKRDLFPGFYYGSRLSWILPGFAAHRLFSPVVANAVLHLGVHSISVLCLFYTLRKTIGLRGAYLGAMTFSLYPWLWAATGWDYASGGAIVYFLMAMALLTRAAGTAGGRWTLLSAGAAIAGMVYSQLYMLSFGPLLAIQYVVLARSWQRTPVLRSAGALCLWAGVGFAIFTVPLSVINALWVDGTPWFWMPSLQTAQRVTTNYTWTESLVYQNRLDPYLWMIVAASAVALALLPAAWQQVTARRNPAPAIFSVHLLYATGLMVLLQSRGITLLGHYYYSCYLLPLVYLVFGAWLWPGADEMKRKQWLITCGTSTALFGLLWVAPEYNPVLAKVLPEWLAFMLGFCVLASGLWLRESSRGVWLGLGGLLMLTSLTYTGNHREVNIHATREEYSRVMDARRVVEQDRRGEPVRFWYDREEPAFHEYFALNATYMAEFARIGERFPQDCRAGVELGSLVVVTSRKENTPQLAARALSDCWRSSGMTAAVQTVQAVARPYAPYMLVVLKAVDDFSVRRPLRMVLDTNRGGYRLELVPNATEGRSLPAELWVPSTGATLERVAGEVRASTPPGGTAYAFSYAPVTVPESGKYRFEMKCRLQSGSIAFGAFPADESRWLGSDMVGRNTPSGREMGFTLDLKAGETVILRIANSNSAQKASSFVLGDTSIIALAQ